MSNSVCLLFVKEYNCEIVFPKWLLLLLLLDYNSDNPVFLAQHVSEFGLNKHK